MKQIFKILTLGTLITSCGCTAPQWKSRKERAAHAAQARAEQNKKRPQKSIKDIKIVEEAIESANYYEQNQNYDLTIAAFQRVIAIAKDPHIVATYIMKLADLYFSHGKLSEAQQQYAKLVSLYPGSPDVERARYREITTTFMNTLKPSRDQSDTHTTIAKGKKYLTDYPDRTEACANVKSIIAAAYTRLAAHELFVVDYYLNKFTIDHSPTSLRAAASRLVHTTETVIPAVNTYLPDRKKMLKGTALPEPLSDETSELAALTEYYYQLLNATQRLHAQIDPLLLQISFLNREQL